MPKTDPITEILTRGVEEVIVKKELEELLRSGKKITLYLGIDPTGSLLHLGHAIALRKLRDFLYLGHHVIFLIGSFTALIGDTSDKDSLRVPLTPEQIEANFKTYKTQASKILDFSKIELKYNGEWLSKLNFKDILGLANRFTVQQMIEREMYRKRIKEGKPIGLHEFLYPLMQGYDSVAMDVDLEVGGNDQLFNMLAGRTLQKVLRNRNKHVLTVKLLEGTDGRKMAKTYGNVINIADEPQEQYGRVMSMKDELILQYFELCTDVPIHEIEEIKHALKAGENPKNAKMRLAREIVAFYHGKDAGAGAEKEFIKTSKSDARRLIEGGGVSIGEKRAADPKIEIKLGKKPILIKVGKRHFLKVKTK
ncbi:tyrosine--tRNA ligase [Candidatus Peregrinibacteria bacterium]|nr:tyrosine--tRNA ligase [Candidatus Peregrinibacteria bacterium]